MSQSRLPKDDPLPHPLASYSKEEVKQESQAAIEGAREGIARAHQEFDRTRQLITQAEELRQQTRACRERKAEQHARSASARTATPPEARGILLIEDNPADVRLFSEALAQDGFPWPLTVLTCQNEVKAFVQRDAAARTAPPQLIVLDAYIPGMEVAEILAALRSLPAYAALPMILFSSLDEVEGQRCSTELGATAFVHKPGDLEVFFAAVAAILHRWGRRDDELATGLGHEGVC